MVEASAADSALELETHSFLIFKSITLLHTQQHISLTTNIAPVYYTITISVDTHLIIDDMGLIVDAA